MKINTILFDLDGTLLPMTQEKFIQVYFSQLVKRFSPYGFDKDALISAVWKGTKAMIANDGSRTNYDAFWTTFSGLLGKKVLELLDEFDDFYSKEFYQVRQLIPEGYSCRELISQLQQQGYTLALATNPIFPYVASVSRLHWISLTTDDFAHITTMENSRFSKPNLQYYRELMKTLKVSPEQCLMVGNNPADDMCAAELGCKVFLVPEYLENEQHMDITPYPQGRLTDIPAYLATL